MSDYLIESHRTQLAASAIVPHIITERGYYSAEQPDDLPAAFADYQRRPGLVIPIRDTTGNVVAWQLKADNPRHDKDGRPIKYETAAGGRSCLDVPTRSRPLLDNPLVPLWITEGAKKVDSGLSHGIRCITGLQGVWNWRGTNEYGGKRALPDWEVIALNGRDVILAFDSDVMVKEAVRDALERLAAFLQQRQAHVRYLLLPHPGEGKEA